MSLENVIAENTQAINNLAELIRQARPRPRHLSHRRPPRTTASMSRRNRRPSLKTHLLQHLLRLPRPRLSLSPHPRSPWITKPFVRRSCRR